MKRLLKEPLVHFIALALLVFGSYALIATDKQAPDSIVISAQKIEQLAEVFAKTWQRPPTPQELKSLIDDYVREEIYVREALALRLDEDDTVIRRRLRQKMEFLTAADMEGTIPTDAELLAFLAGQPEVFRIEPRIALQQIFVSPERHGERIQREAHSILEMIRASPQADPPALGDPTLLPTALPLTGKSSIGQIFGADFADALDRAEIGRWQGPLASSFGLHLIHITAREPGRMPELSDVRNVVLREWSNDRRRQADERRLGELLKRYQVKIEMPMVTDIKP